MDKRRNGKEEKGQTSPLVLPFPVSPFPLFSPAG
jgi:hypothetical protein